MNPFEPGATKTITVSASSQRVALPQRVGPVQVRICNLGSATAFVNFGDDTVTAAATDLPVPGNGFTEVLTVNKGVDVLYAAAIAGGATGDISFTIGGGV